MVLHLLIFPKFAHVTAFYFPFIQPGLEDAIRGNGINRYCETEPPPQAFLGRSVRQFLAPGGSFRRPDRKSVV